MTDTVVWLKDHARASAMTTGLGTSEGHSPSGQWSENQRSAFSRRPTLMSAPSSSALSFFPSSKARELTVESGTPSMSPYARATRSNCSMPDIRGISVSLPVLSTAILPGAPALTSGHPTGMEPKIVLENILRLLLEKGRKSDEVSRSAGHPDAIRNFQRKVLAGGRGSLRADTLDAIARQLDVSTDQLTRPAKAPVAVLSLEYLMAQRDLLNRQIADLQEAERAAEKKPKRKNR